MPLKLQALDLDVPNRDNLLMFVAGPDRLSIREAVLLGRGACALGLGGWVKVEPSKSIKF